MSTSGAGVVLEQYRSALEAKLVRLMRLQAIAARQLATTQVADIAALRRESDERDAITSELLLLDRHIRTAYDRVCREPAAQRLPGFPHALTLSQTLTEMVKDILETDRISIRTLEAIVVERRAELQAAEQAANTLSAYARMAAPPTTARLVNGRG
jgi:hypothetical protein